MRNSKFPPSTKQVEIVASVEVEVSSNHFERDVKGAIADLQHVLNRAGYAKVKLQALIVNKP